MSDGARAAASARIVEHLAGLPLTRWIGAYASIDGEVDLDAFLTTQNQICLPRISGREMRFHVLDGALELNRWEIPEPPASAPIVAGEEIGTLLTPLVAFDDQGTRLGFGGGFYDRFLAELHPKHRPWVIGVAFACQRADDPLPRADWDQPLDAVVTENGVVEFGASRL